MEVRKEIMYELNTLMDKRDVCFTCGGEKEKILNELVELSYKNGRVPDLEVFRTAILEREKIISTGIGLGVAVPHAKLPGIEKFFITVGILSEPTDWQAIDDKPASIVFLIGGPDNRQKDYLSILSKLVLFSKNEKRRKALKEATSAEEIINLFTMKN